MYKWSEMRNFFSTELNGWSRDCAVAGIFLTRLPFPQIKGGAKKGSLAAATRAFPLIGVIVGAIAGLALMGSAALGLSPLACALIGLAAAAWVTGALHEDGLADVADGLGGGDTVDQAGLQWPLYGHLCDMMFENPMYGMSTCNADELIQENMVCSSEAFLAWEGVGSVGFEENMIVTKDGVEIITTSPIYWE